MNASKADLMVDLTSDGWFGRSRVPALHLALARLRAVEHRRYLVHATTTGITAIVDPAGRIVDALPADAPGSMVSTIRWMSGTSPYESLGDSLGILATMVGAWFLLGPSRGRGRRGRRIS
jgi:apolipoprotein N-acyltransferase